MLYTVTVHETSYYIREVEAENEDEVEDKIYDGEWLRELETEGNADVTITEIEEGGFQEFKEVK